MRTTKHFYKNGNDIAMTAAEFNEKFTIGTRVVYLPIIDETMGAVMTETRSEAWTLGHGEVVVKVKGITGCVCISHLLNSTPETEQKAH